MQLRQLFFLFLLSVPCLYGQSQPRIYTASNAHSHNDYVNPVPFYTAYKAGFGSIEADIFLFHDRLLVGHDSADLVKGRTLEEYYLRPLDSCIRYYKGNVYADPAKQLIWLIDIKNAPAATLDSLVALLERYPAVVKSKMLRVTITGNRPAPASYIKFPSFIWFDGVLAGTYTDIELTRIVLFSDNLRSYVNWKGADALLPADAEKLDRAIKRSHALNKPVRFWNAPDTPYAWEQLMKLNADYINTDHIAELAHFFAVTAEMGHK